MDWNCAEHENVFKTSWTSRVILWFHDWLIGFLRMVTSVRWAETLKDDLGWWNTECQDHPQPIPTPDRKGNGRSTGKKWPGSRCLERRSRRTGPGAVTRDGLEKLGLAKTSKPRLQKFGAWIAASIHGNPRSSFESSNLSVKLVKTNAADFVVPCSFRTSVCISASIHRLLYAHCKLAQQLLASWRCIVPVGPHALHFPHKVPGFEPSLLDLGPVCHAGGGSSASCALWKRVGSQRAAESFRALPGGAGARRPLTVVTVSEPVDIHRYSIGGRAVKEKLRLLFTLTMFNCSTVWHVPEIIHGP